MTAPTVVPFHPDWLPTAEVARALGRCEYRAREAMKSSRVHAHRNPHRAGAWWMRRCVLEAARLGVSVERQVVLCGCAGRDWSPPPLLLGRARRRHRIAPVS